MDLWTAARSARVFRGTIVEERGGGGSGLALALDEGGTAALVGLLAEDVDRVELDDEDVTVRVERAGGQEVWVRTAWASGEVSEQRVPAGPGVPVEDVAAALHDPLIPIHFRDGQWWRGVPTAGASMVVPAIRPEQLGSGEFRAAHGVRAAYLAGAMAGGIASAELVLAMGRAGYLAYFGAGGLPIEAVRAGVERITTESGGRPFGFNLLHNPAEPAVEEGTVDLYLEHGVKEVDASAYMGLTPAVVRFRLTGIREDDGRIVTLNRVSAKVSRPEVAEHFLRPAPKKILDELVARGALTPRQAELARNVPIAEDVTAEADSGGHTDRRPLPVLIPIFRRLVERITAEQGYAVRPRVGAAGGIGDPWSFAAALQLGADYVMTGSINQCTVEAGTSIEVKRMLAEAGYADITQGPAPDMFEIGANVQVLGRGTMYAQRAKILYDLYRAHGSLEEISEADRTKVEKQIFQRSISEVAVETDAYWTARDPREAERAAKDPHHRMALVFRWYLGMTSRWARIGESSRKRDYQVWCGPAMGLFNDWVRGSGLEPIETRGVVRVADALLRGACVAIRVGMVRNAGLPIPADAERVLPRSD